MRRAHRVRCDAESFNMGENCLKGIDKQVWGSLEGATGKVSRPEAEGAAERTAGKVENTVGGAKDAVPAAVS